MNTIDLNLMHLNAEGDMTLSLRNMNGRAVGLKKTLGKWIKMFYGKEVGGVLAVIKTGKTTHIQSKILNSIALTNREVTRIQSLLEISDSERFADCRLKSLDILKETGAINISLVFTTAATSVDVNLQEVS